MNLYYIYNWQKVGYNVANILFTNVCNLKCPYCFASDIVNKNNEELLPENFYKLLDFIFKDNSNSNERIGVLGGEPTICSHFEEYFTVLLQDERVKHITLMTNGTLLDKYCDLMVNDKVSVLINFNKEEVVGHTIYNKVINNIDKLCRVGKEKHWCNITLGLNFWDYNGNNSYMINTCKHFGFNTIRFSLLVPNFAVEQNAIEYFAERKQQAMIFFALCLRNGIYPQVDCNWMMPCLFTEQDKLVLQHFAQDNDLFQSCFRIKMNGVGCGCPIDIYPNMTASRCFGTSKIIKKVFDYDNFAELRKSFRQDLDSKYKNVKFNEQCNNCQLQCEGGCLGFKINKEMFGENNVGK